MAHIRCKNSKGEHSSQLFSMDYEPIEQRLRVKFNCPSCRGKAHADHAAAVCPKCKGEGWTTEYEYDKVPQDVYAAVRDGKRGPDDPESIGGAFNHHVKRGGYAYRKL